MSLDRRVLARVDRRLFSGLDHSDGVQLVKVPVSDAVWSTWRRVNGQLDVLAGGHRRSPLVAKKSPRVLGVTSCGPVGESPAVSAGSDDVGVVA